MTEVKWMVQLRKFVDYLAKQCLRGAHGIVGSILPSKPKNDQPRMRGSRDVLDHIRDCLVDKGYKLDHITNMQFKKCSDLGLKTKFRPRISDMCREYRSEGVRSQDR